MVQRHDRHRGVKVSLCVDQRDRLDPGTRLRHGIDRGHRIACGPQVCGELAVAGADLQDPRRRRRERSAHEGDDVGGQHLPMIAHRCPRGWHSHCRLWADVDGDVVEDLVATGQRDERGDDLAIVKDVDACETPAGVAAETAGGERVGVARGRGAHPHGHVGERPRTHAVGVAAEDQAHVAAADRIRQALRGPQGDELRHRGRRPDRRMVDDEDRPRGRRLAELSAEPIELLVVELTVIAVGDARVKPDHTEIAHPENAVHGVIAGGKPEQRRTEKSTIVVIARDHEQPCAERAHAALDHRSEPAVRRRLATVGLIAGEHDDIGANSGALEDCEHSVNPRDRIEAPEQPAVGRHVTVGDLHEDEPRSAHPAHCAVTMSST